MKKINSCDGRYESSLDVRFTKACDNNCAFCIEKEGLDNQGQDVEKMIASTKASKKDTVLILGGEPLLNIGKVLEYVKGIRESKREIYLTTSLPQSIEKDYKGFQDILENLAGLNVSLQHYDWKKNNEILQAKNPYNRMSILSKILEEEAQATKVRVSINLVKGSIDSKEELETCIKELERIGVKHLKINELQDSEGSYVNYEKIMGKKLGSPYSTGCQTELEERESGMRITLKRACFIVEPSLKASVRDGIKVIYKSLRKQDETRQEVMYENGRVSEGWEKGGER